MRKVVTTRRRSLLCIDLAAAILPGHAEHVKSLILGQIRTQVTLSGLSWTKTRVDSAAGRFRL
jgi:hypothetical protein